MQIHLRTAALIATVWWDIYALLFALNVVAMGEQQGIPVSWGEAAIFSFGGWLTWIPFSVGLYILVCRFPLDPGRIVVSAAVLMAAVLAVVLIKAVYVYLTHPVFNWYVQSPSFQVVLIDSLKMNFMMGWAVVAVAHGLLFYHRARERRLKVVELERDLASARLDVIQAKLSPHFLFNALNSVSEMIHQDVEQADEMLLALSRLLRDGFSRDQRQERPVSEEVALVEDYLMIEKCRLGDRLQVDWQVDRRCMQALIPALTLQPLAENAIIHSIARRREPGWLRIHVSAGESRLIVRVENSLSPDQAGSSVSGGGVGLRSLSARLPLLYGADASVVIDRSDPSAFVVALDLPLFVQQRDAA